MKKNSSKDKKILNEKFQKMRRKNKILILISIILIVIIALFANNFMTASIKFIIIIDTVLLIIMFIFMLINVVKMLSILRIVKNMFTEKEIEDARHKSNKTHK